MKVLLLSSLEYHSGLSLRARGLAGALAARGHDVRLLEPVPRGVVPETPSGVSRAPCPRLSGPPRRQAILWLLAGVAAVLRWRPEVAYSLKALPNAWCAALVARALGARLLVDLDDLDYDYSPPGAERELVRVFFEHSARRADAVTTHNFALRDRIGALRGGTPPLIVDQGIDADRFFGAVAPPNLRQRLALGPGPVVLYAGHLGPASDLEPLLMSLGSVAKAFPGSRLLVVGDGDRRVALETAARAVLPPAFTVFAGRVEHRDVPGYYALADVAVNYLGENEANRYRASIKLREALAAGLPVVASRTADAERFDGFVRFPAKPGPRAFVEALREELAAPDRVRAARGAAHVRETCRWDVAARAVCSLLHEWEEDPRQRVHRRGFPRISR